MKTQAHSGLLVGMVWATIALAQCPLSDTLERLSSEEILGDCKTLFRAGLPLASPLAVNASRARVSQSPEWAYPKTIPRRQRTRYPVSKS